MTHDGGADLYSRTLAPDRRTAGEADERKQELAGGHAQRQHGADVGRIFHFGCSDHLRNAAALGAGENMDRQQHAERQTGGRDNERQQWVDAEGKVEQRVRQGGCFGKADGDQTDHKRAGREHKAAKPVLPREQPVAQDVWSGSKHASV
jgi:hypothetical protein